MLHIKWLRLESRRLCTNATLIVDIGPLSSGPTSAIQLGAPPSAAPHGPPARSRRQQTGGRSAPAAGDAPRKAPAPAQSPLLTVPLCSAPRLAAQSCRPCRRHPLQESAGPNAGLQLGGRSAARAERRRSLTSCPCLQAQRCRRRPAAVRRARRVSADLPLLRAAAREPMRLAAPSRFRRHHPAPRRRCLKVAARAMETFRPRSDFQALAISLGP